MMENPLFEETPNSSKFLNSYTPACRSTANCHTQTVTGHYGGSSRHSVSPIIPHSLTFLPSSRPSQMSLRASLHVWYNGSDLSLSLALSSSRQIDWRYKDTLVWDVRKEDIYKARGMPFHHQLILTSPHHEVSRSSPCCRGSCPFPVCRHKQDWGKEGNTVLIRVKAWNSLDSLHRKKVTWIRANLYLYSLLPWARQYIIIYR